MKTTIDIPEGPYRKAKIRAVERGLTLKQIVLTSLEGDLDARQRGEELSPSYRANRKLHPGYQGALQAGAVFGGTDSTMIVSEDRTSRDEALL